LPYKVTKHEVKTKLPEKPTI